MSSKSFNLHLFFGPIYDMQIPLEQVPLKMKDVDRAKKKASPLSAVKEQQRMQVVQKRRSGPAF